MNKNFFQRLTSIIGRYWTELLLKFIAVLGGIWLLLEVLTFFNPYSFGTSIQTWRGGIGLWIILAVSLLVSLFTTKRTSPEQIVDTQPITETCGDKGISLAQQRLRVSDTFGSYFARLLEEDNIHVTLSEQVDCTVLDTSPELSALERIMWAFTQPNGPRLVVIGADGGMGKSTIAAKITRCLVERQHIELILGDSAKNQYLNPLEGKRIKTRHVVYKSIFAFRKISAQLSLPFSDSNNTRKILSAIKDKLVDRSALIIIDNLETVEDIDDLLRGLSKLVSRTVRVLVTTRDLEKINYFTSKYLMVNLRPISTYGSAVKFIKWHIHHYQAQHNSLTHLLADLSSKTTINKLIEISGGLPLAIQLLLSDVIFNSWDYLDTLPRGYGHYELLHYLYDDRWHDLDSIGRSGVVAQEILRFVSDEQEKGKRITFNRLRIHVEMKRGSEELSASLRVLHERFLIVNQDTAEGNYVVTPVLAQFVWQKDNSKL